MEKLIHRISHDNEISEFAKMIMMVYSLPRIPEKTDAIVAFPGLGEIWRTVHAIEWWQTRGFLGHFLLIAGNNENETTSEDLTIERLKEPPFNLRRLEGVHSQIRGNNTKIQSEWIYKCVVELGINSVSLFVSPYHMLRAYLTLLKTFLDGNFKIPLIPIPTPISPYRIIPELGVDSWSLVPGELQRIQAYQEKADVATLDELANYMKWVWEQPIFCDEMVV